MSKSRVAERSAAYALQTAVEPAFGTPFDLLATAPQGVAKLRELILSLAVRGKLLPQNHQDEPAAASFARITAAKDHMVAEGVIRQRKAAGPIDKADKLFELPANWELARLADLVAILNGRAYAKDELLSSGVPVLRVGNLFTSNHWYYSNLTLEPEKYCDVGDLLFAWSASFGPFIWPGPKAIYHYHIWKLNLHSANDLNKNYLYTFLLKKTQEIKAAGHGVSMLHMTKEKMEKIVVPLPPLAEQARIVARVEELMRLCDALEAHGRLQDEQHARLVATLFDTLAASASTEELAENWRRIATHFDLLLDRPEAVDTLEQTLLQLAVRGLLVPQDPNDESVSSSPADTMLDDGVNEDIRSTDKSEESWPFDLPPNWKWRRLESLQPEFQNGVSSRGDSGGIPVTVVRLADVTNGRIDLHDPRVLPIKAASVSKYAIEAGDVLIIRVNGSADLVGRFVLCTEEQHAIYCDHFIRMRLPMSVVIPSYLELVGSTKVVRDEISAMFVTTAGQKTVNQGHIRALSLPIPPLAEQHRIVARVEQLRRLCADLRERLQQARVTQFRLADALVSAAAQSPTC